MVSPVERPTFFYARWIFLRSLGVWFFSAFYSLAFQIHGLIGAQGISPAADLLDVLRQEQGLSAGLHAVPSLLWLSSSEGALTALWIVGMAASVALVLNLWPRFSIAIATLCFLSFISAAQQFSSYQSDGMLMQAGFCSFFFAPRGVRPRLGLSDPPSRLARLSLVWLWFAIYFGSGVVKILSHDEQWRNLTAMDHYYENGPLPSFLGWYVQELMPQWFHAATAGATLLLELVLCWLCFLPRRFRIVLFWIVTPFQIGIIFTSNYAFLNWLVLSLGFLLLDDRHFARFKLGLPERDLRPAWQPPTRTFNVLAALSLGVVFYVSGLELFGRFLPFLDVFSTAPVEFLEPFRIANPYGLFAVMTRNRYEIEFQGSNDGETWTPYPFRYKPQALDRGGAIYAPYQPRFEWNLWFASLGNPRNEGWVRSAAERLVDGSPAVLALFRDDPFHGNPPKAVRAVRWQYWYTTPAEKKATGNYWKRDLRGIYVEPLGRL